MVGTIYIYIYIYVYIWHFWQGNHQIYGHIRRVYTARANSTKDNVFVQHAVATSAQRSVLDQRSVLAKRSVLVQHAVATSAQRMTWPKNDVANE